MQKKSLYSLLTLFVILFCSVSLSKAEQINLLAIRVDFVTDSLNTTFGDGSFNSGFVSDSTDYSYPFDRTPHDSLYFAHHLRFLDFYYDRVSGGDVSITSAVYPQGADAAYHLPYPMWHYNYNNPDLLDLQLVELFRDAILACADDSTIAFSNYDRVFIFHAGTGQDFGQDLTPFDIPSAYIFPADLQLLSEENPSYVNGIPVWDGTLITEGAILPEAEHQEHIAHGLAGTIVLQFGHAIGLPNLYNSENGRAAIGKWGLMDQGSANFRGLIPAQPSAWTRLYKGWAVAEELVLDSDSLRIRSVGTLSNDPEIYQVRLTDLESYLVENRIRDRNGDTLTWGVDSAGDTIYFHQDYTVSFSGDTTGVIVEVEDLDYDIPGSGLLIWHLDESRITPYTIENNSINDDPDRRGVDLEEGDGVQDIGQDLSTFHPRGGAVAGNFYDAWCDSNEAFLYVNRQLSEVEFSNLSIPDTRTNDGFETDIRFFDFSASDTVMTFSFNRSGRLPGYPVSCGDTVLSETATLLNSNEHDLLLALTAENWLCGFSSTGEVLYPDPTGGTDGALPLVYNEELTAFAVRDSLLATLELDNTQLLLREFTWSLDQETGEYDLTWLPPQSVQTTHTDMLALNNGWLLWGVDKVQRFTSTSQKDWTLPGNVVQAGLIGDLPWLLVEGAGLYLLDQDEDVWERLIDAPFTADSPQPVSGIMNVRVNTNPWLLLAIGDYLTCIDEAGEERWQQYRPGLQLLALSDLDADGVLEIIATTMTAVYLYNPEGVLIGQRQFDEAEQVRIFPTPTGKNGLYLCGAEEVGGWDYDGGWGPITGFPRTLPSDDAQLLYSPAGRFYLCGTMELTAFSAATGDGPYWSQHGGNASHDFRLAEASPHSSPEREELVSGQVYNWPNPSRHNEPVHIVYTAAMAATIEVNIYDRTGRQVHKCFDSIGAWSSGETIWDVTSVASGVYYAHVEATFAGANKTNEILKIAVIK